MAVKPTLSIETQTKTQISQGVATLLVFIFGAAGAFGIYFFTQKNENTYADSLLVLDKRNEATSAVVKPNVSVAYEGIFENYGQLVAANIDSDAEKETLYASGQGILHAWNMDGTEVAGNWPVDLGGDVASAASVGNLDEDSNPEIVVSAFDRLYILENDGSVKTNWPVERLVAMQTPLLHDFTGDGIDEIVLAGRNEAGSFKVYAYTSDGDVISPWPLPLDNNVNIQSVSMGNLDSDADMEIVGLANVNGGGSNAAIYAWNFDGTVVDGDGNGTTDWPQYYPYTYDPGDGLGQPTLADLDGDGKDEIIHYGEGDFTVKVFVWKADGTPLANWPKALSQGEWVFSTNMVVAGNIAGDIKPEIVATVGFAETQSKVYAWDYRGELVRGFPVELSGNIRPAYMPLVVDVTGDSRSEIITNLWQPGRSAHTVYAVDYRGQKIQNNFWPLQIGNSEISTGVLVAPMTSENGGWLITTFYGNGSNRINWYDLNQRINQGDWTMYKHDAKHTGRYIPLPTITPTNDTLTDVIQE